MFEFKHIKAFDRAYIDNPGPMVVFATPGMLHAGLSLQIFKRWAPNDNNMVKAVYQKHINHTVTLFENREKSRYQMRGWPLG